MTDHMAVLNGCEDKRNAVTIEEVKCPKCGAEMEIYVKDGKVNRVTAPGTAGRHRPPQGRGWCRLCSRPEQILRKYQPVFTEPVLHEEKS